MPTTRSPEPKPASRKQLAALALVLASAAIAFCCSSPPKPVAAPATATASALPGPDADADAGADAGAVADAEADAGAAADAGADDPLLRSKGHELVNFARALKELAAKTRQRHVRVTWLGDSHGAGDYWSGALRTALQTKFGDGGPGFINVGYKQARHDNVSVRLDGVWSSTPKGPSTIVKSSDGVFGLGGVLFKGSESPRASIEIKDDAAQGNLTWDLCYRPTPGQELDLTFSGEAAKVHVKSEGSGLHHVLHTSASRQMGIAATSGEPWLCGLAVETDPVLHPGVVLDQLGINGARLATPLAWNGDAWIEEVKRRPSDLLILEYGTNEAGDAFADPKRYEANLSAVVARARAADEACDCLVLSNTDRNDTESKNEGVRDALKYAAEQVGCAFWDTYATMGGAGSIAKWRNEMPPRAGPDGVHLTWHGYRDLGEKLSAFVLDQVAK